MGSSKRANVPFKLWARKAFPVCVPGNARAHIRFTPGHTLLKDFSLPVSMSEQDDDIIQRRRNPLVIVGCGLTAGVLVVGLIAFKQGNSQLSQKMMRARVMAQAGTVALMLGSSAYAGLAGST